MEPSERHLLETRTRRGHALPSLTTGDAPEV